MTTIDLTPKHYPINRSDLYPWRLVPLAKFVEFLDKNPTYQLEGPVIGKFLGSSGGYFVHNEYYEYMEIGADGQWKIGEVKISSPWDIERLRKHGAKFAVYDSLWIKVLIACESSLKKIERKTWYIFCKECLYWCRRRYYLARYKVLKIIEILKGEW